jgi:hypothetical protein
MRARTLDAIRALVGSLSRSAGSVERRTGVTTAQLFVLRQTIAADSSCHSPPLERAALRRRSTRTAPLLMAGRGVIRATAREQSCIQPARLPHSAI